MTKMVNDIARLKDEVTRSARTMRRTALLAAVVVLACGGGAAMADPVTFPNNGAPPGGATHDGCSGCLFLYENTPTAATGQAIVSWIFYAASTAPVTPVIFNAAGVVVGVGTTITPSGTGLQTNLFGRTDGTSVVAAGDSVGFYCSNGGSIAVTLGSGSQITEEGGFGGLRAGTTQIDTSSTIGNRTYYVSFTSSQVTLGPATAPAGGATTDGCQNCLFEYTPVTSDYNGSLLSSWDFYALNLNAATPVIFDSNGNVIGYGETNTPTATGYQSFSYVPVWGSNVLATGDYLGWYYPDGGSIAMSLTGGQGGTYAPFPQPSLGPGDTTSTAITGRNYAVGFVTAQPSAATPEPGYMGIVACGFGLMLLLRRDVLYGEK